MLVDMGMKFDAFFNVRACVGDRSFLPVGYRFLVKMGNAEC